MVQKGPGLVFKDVDLTNEGVTRKVLEVIALWQPEILGEFFAKRRYQERLDEADAYLDTFLTELGVRQFMTNPVTIVMARRLMDFIEDPKQAANEIKRLLRWEDNVEDAIVVLNDHLVDALHASGAARSFVAGLLRSLSGDSVVREFKHLLEYLRLNELHTNSALRLLAETYLSTPRYSGKSLAEILWGFIQEANTPEDFVKRFRRKFRKLASKVDQEALTTVALALFKEQERRWFFGIVQSVVDHLGLPQSKTFRNSAFSVIVRSQLNDMDEEMAVASELQKAQKIADALRQEFKEQAAGEKDALRDFLMARYNLVSSNPTHQKNLNWLVTQIMIRFGSDH